MAIEEQVRARLRQARFERGLSLAELGERAGLTASTISRLETGARRLTLAQVERLAAALELSTDALLASDAEPSPARDGRVWQPVGDESTSGPRVYRIVVPVEAPARHQHEGHQWLHVLSGTVRLIVGAGERELREGDSAEFSTWEPHALSAVGHPAEALVVFRP
ncbi:helix-turn-helix transcriptional regulator [Solirubrobacter phytolaccae]|uniref:Helix-turn-helix transcriptional regulator n=1 Tax=Solirubrobacter phytolaccae TaxID=1404360 RepID=A0A9X3NBZ5_9ACTN|nr:helix-turn-helix transcriptional regulator [Solirubrobacter phytolaccae]MDA0183166.1 helix-turn-helix transcriptional regulator [Solirubrobacter phytolaccae]